jgi:replicative DNA helicase
MSHLLSNEQLIAAANSFGTPLYVYDAANIEAHARIVQEKFIQRELIRISSEIITDAYDDTTDVFDLLDAAEQKLFSIANDKLKKEFDTLGKGVMDALNRID